MRCGHCGAPPAEHRSDSLSARAFRNLDADARRDLTIRYAMSETHRPMCDVTIGFDGLPI
jgi:hypothetical protein